MRGRPCNAALGLGVLDEANPGCCGCCLHHTVLVFHIVMVSMFHVPALRLSPRRRWQRAPQEGWHRLCSCFLGSCCAGSHGGAALAPPSHPRRAPQQRWEGSTPVLFIAELRSPTAGAEAAASPCLVPAVTWGHPLCLRWGMGCSEGGGVGYGVAVALSRAPPRVQVARGVPVGMNPSSWLSHSWVGPVAPYSS